MKFKNPELSLAAKVYQTFIALSHPRGPLIITKPLLTVANRMPLFAQSENKHKNYMTFNFG